MDVVVALPQNKVVETISLIQALAPHIGTFVGTRLLNKGTVSLNEFTHGYGITRGTRILEIGATLPYTWPNDNYYLGPQNYFVKRSEEMVDCLTQEKVVLTAAMFSQFNLRDHLAGVAEFGKNLITPSTPIPPNLQFIGVAPEKFSPYKNIRTTKGYLCGSVASSVLFSYLQDNEQLTLPTLLRVPHQNSSEKLTAKIIAYTQPLDLPTLPVQVALGWHRFFHHYRIKVKIKTQALGAKLFFTKLCQHNQPAVIGVLRYFGSTYGNHWVTAYAYAEVSGQTFYRIHDNWGDTQKIIASTWGNGLITVAKQTTF